MEITKKKNQANYIRKVWTRIDLLAYHVQVKCTNKNPLVDLNIYYYISDVLGCKEQLSKGDANEINLLLYHLKRKIQSTRTNLNNNEDEQECDDGSGGRFAGLQLQQTEITKQQDADMRKALGIKERYRSTEDKDDNIRQISYKFDYQFKGPRTHRQETVEE